MLRKVVNKQGRYDKNDRQMRFSIFLGMAGIVCLAMCMQAASYAARPHSQAAMLT